MSHHYWTRPEVERMIVGAELMIFWDNLGEHMGQVSDGLKEKLLRGDGFRILPVYIEDYEAGSCILSRYWQ